MNPESNNEHLRAESNVMIEQAECILCIAWWTTGMNAHHLLPKEEETHFTAHIAHISFWDQFSCYMIVINVVAVRNLLPQITDMNDISYACKISL